MSRLIPVNPVIPVSYVGLHSLFLAGAGDDRDAARDAAIRMLNVYHPETEDEFRLAAKIVGFSFQAIQALGQAAMPDLPVTRVLRLRGGAVSLSRASEKAERRLDLLRKARRQGVVAQPVVAEPEPARVEPAVVKAVEVIEDTGKVAALAKASGVSWSAAYDQRQTDLRIAASLKRAEARIAAMSGAGVMAAAGGEARAGRSAA